MLRLVAAGPALAGLGALTGAGPLRRLGAGIAAGSALAFLDISTRTVVPGANDNLTAVAVILELARALREQPVRGVRVLLVSTGSEESFMEGMRGWVRRHGPGLDPGRTRVVVLETLGSPELILLEGEGMIWMNDYDEGVREFLAECAQLAGVPLRRGLRLGFATDALSALRGGLRTATLASCDEYKMPSNYHSQRDVPGNVDFGTVAAAVRVAEAAIRTAASGPG
jgi:Zn-dependent M28 family amino/carboxypeptidase